MSTAARIGRRSLVALIVLTAGAALMPAYAAACAKPVATIPAFAQGATNTLSWTQQTGTLEGNGFIVEVSTSLDQKADGSFVSTVATASQPLGSRSRSFDGLAERTHYLHVRARASSQCSIGPWSEIVSSTQDATPPVLTMAPPERQVYVLETITILGTAVDSPAEPATISSGAREVIVSLENQIAPLAANHDQPRALVAVNADGTWSAGFADVPLGAYAVTAIAGDRVGNVSEPATTQVVVVGAP